MFLRSAEYADGYAGNDVILLVGWITKGTLLIQCSFIVYKLFVLSKIINSLQTFVNNLLI
jgi:hypothetical protein